MSATERIRVLVVDDSAFARRVLRQTLAASPGIEVVGIAADGLEALEQIEQLKPDVITLDLLMPNLDGLGVLRQLAELRSPVRVVVVTISDEASEIVAEALQLGAISRVKKPTALATDRLYELGGELIEKVRAAAAATSPASRGPIAAQRPGLATNASGRRGARQVKLVTVGTSTGGPHALTRLLEEIPPDFPAPIAIALHIPGEYTAALAERLDRICALQVREAQDGLTLAPGTVILAKGGRHMTIEGVPDALRVCVDARPQRLYSPSVDLLFESAARVTGSETLGVVMTGMGDDGLLGARAIVAAGGRVLTEAQSSCVIYGMPRCIDEAGLSTARVPLEDMARAIVERL